MGAGGFWIDQGAETTRVGSPYFDVPVQPLTEQQARQALEGKHSYILEMDRSLPVPGLYDEPRGFW